MVDEKIEVQIGKKKRTVFNIDAGFSNKERFLLLKRKLMANINVNLSNAKFVEFLLDKMEGKEVVVS